VKTKKLSKMRILNKLGDHTMHRSISFEPEQLRRYLRHTRPIQKWYMRQLHISFLENFFGIFKKPFVAVQIPWCFFGDLPLDIGRVGGIIEAKTVLPK
jgi:hypothetical protein